jgi:hypothetical protein
LVTNIIRTIRKCSSMKKEEEAAEKDIREQAL